WPSPSRCSTPCYRAASGSGACALSRSGCGSAWPRGRWSYEHWTSAGWQRGAAGRRVTLGKDGEMSHRWITILIAFALAGCIGGGEALPGPDARWGVTPSACETDADCE